MLVFVTVDDFMQQGIKDGMPLEEQLRILLDKMDTANTMLHGGQTLLILLAVPVSWCIRILFGVKRLHATEVQAICPGHTLKHVYHLSREVEQLVLEILGGRLKWGFLLGFFLLNQ